MRISVPNRFAQAKGHSQTGMAVIVVMTLLAIILLYIAYNARTLHHLGRELKFLEQKQTQRLAATSVRTNLVQALKPSAPTTAPESPAR